MIVYWDQANICNVVISYNGEFFWYIRTSLYIARSVTKNDVVCSLVIKITHFELITGIPSRPRGRAMVYIWVFVYECICGENCCNPTLTGAYRLWAYGVLNRSENRWYWLTGPEVRQDMWYPGQPDLHTNENTVLIWDYNIHDVKHSYLSPGLCEHGKSNAMWAVMVLINWSPFYKQPW